MAFEPGSRRNGALAVMRIVSALELLSLVVILTNRFTVHSPAITSTGGPVHGVLYVSSIVLALLLPFPRSAKWLAVVPGIGGLLAIWRARRVAKLASTATFAHAVGSALTEPDRARAAIVVEDATALLARTTRVGPLTFSVPHGEITGLIGPNGAGKTTALRMLCGLIAPVGGTITVRAQDAPGQTAPPIGVLIDSPAFIPGLSARDNLLVLTRLAGWPPALADRALERVGLSSAAHRRAGTFSLGMKQRLGLAAALLGQPRIVILDEPTNGLDPRGTIELRDFLRTLVEEGITVIIASHALDQIEELCDHLVAMDRGHVFFNGPPQQMLATIPCAIRCRVSSAGALAAAAAAFETDGHPVEVLDTLTLLVPGEAGLGARLNELATRAGVTLSEISPQVPTLQDAFLSLTGNGTRGAAIVDDLAMAEVAR